MTSMAEILKKDDFRRVELLNLVTKNGGMRNLSLEQLIQLVNEFVENNIVIEDASQDSFEERDNLSIKQYVDTDLEKNLSQAQSEALKAITIGFFTNNSKILRLREGGNANCISFWYPSRI